MASNALLNVPLVKNMKNLNWKNIKDNVVEAREELQEIENQIASKNRPSEGELQISIEHAYHHINFAWNSRHMTSKRYTKMSDEDFNLCGKFPKDIEIYYVPLNKRNKKRGV